MTDKPQSLNTPQYLEVKPYSGAIHDTRRVYTDDEMKRFYSPFFPSIDELFKW